MYCTSDRFFSFATGPCKRNSQINVSTNVVNNFFLDTYHKESFLFLKVKGSISKHQKKDRHAEPRQNLTQ